MEVYVLDEDNSRIKKLIEKYVRIVGWREMKKTQN